MHVVTFYSFKGGTGRSMALVNIAVELVKAGLRVLIVDFDLEAPGLDTFNLPRPQKATKGIVDFVLQYLDSDVSPDVSDFVYKSAIPNTNGELWVMPAGIGEDSYDHKFKSIDWQDLYDNREGYLLFEDLKAQWEEYLKPDYVLIDSRTGHTDVGGICTRQLPDSVAIFFFPNEQNCRGLKTVVRQIRGEAETNRKKGISLHFVMSNVPELDDEEGLLASYLMQFKEALQFKNLSAVIHHYDSLSLLTQSVFTLDRPLTRLAKEYQILAHAVRKNNLEDREVALEFLQEVSSKVRRVSAGELAKRINFIETKHSSDPEVLLRLAGLLRRQRRFEEALALLEQIEERGSGSAEFYLSRAELRAITKNIPAALQDVRQLLEKSDATYLEIVPVARLLLQHSPESLGEIIHTSAFKRLDPSGKGYVASELLSSPQGSETAGVILKEVLNQPGIEPSQRREFGNQLVLTLIYSGDYAAAINTLTQDGEYGLNDFDLPETFNYAIADWGLTSKPSPDLFERVVTLNEKAPNETANGYQCLSLALWTLDKPNEALSRLEDARKKVVARFTPEFSCWSYLDLSPEEFFNDLEEMRRLFGGELLKPRFMRINEARRKGEANND